MTKLITIFDKDLNQRVFRLFYENEIIHKIDTSITISSSKSSIDVGENVILSGVLSDAGGNVLSGKNVRILKNNVLVDTVTTDSNGAYSKTISGLSEGTHHFHASFAGDDTYDNALSSTIDVNVLSHVYVVTLLSDKQSILSSESVTLSGTVTRDGEGYAGQSVRLFDGVTLVDTLTTDSSGNFSKTLSNLSVGTHRLFAQFDAYESSIVVVEVRDHDYAINISADNPIIQSGETSIITATLTDGTDPVLDETLSYALSNKGTVVGSGSALTNSNGQISITYVGAGLGDIDVEVAYGIILQETYEIEDCFKYDTTTQTRTTTYNTDRLTPVYNDFSFISDNFSLECTWQLPNSSAEGLGFGIAPKNQTTPYHHILFGIGTGKVSSYVGNKSSGETTERYGSPVWNTEHQMKIEYTDGTVKLYIDDELKTTYNDRTYFNGETRDIVFLEWNSGIPITLKDIKLKAL